ncbi:NADP-dependent mannitol dehydrogenase-like protein 4 [Elsinoe australis]|uniref:NADP-dependent mannitol dehydrogenase-like protein 4 n=1 Tax=Elsinoe australis TaxID=40998 RepID=A0A4U7AWN1_9PEZI|nr:NADP-dependent mannitol dehydrogenase-like protein 4 [Elsinoe australis]
MPLASSPDLSRNVLSQFSLENKVVLVTGGSRGIGLELVGAMAEAGASVAMIYNTTLDAPAKASHIAETNRVRVQAYEADVTNEEAITRVIDEVAKDFGRLDVVIANAGVCSNIESLDYTFESWQKINSVNYDGVMWTARAAGRIFKRQGRGNLVITGSVSSMIVNVPQAQAAYNASKAAAMHLAKCLAVEWVDFARVNCVSPGYINTEMITKQPEHLMNTWLSQVPGGRLAEPAELKAVSSFMSSVE